MKPLYIDDSVQILELVRTYSQDVIGFPILVTTSEAEVLRLVGTGEIDMIIAEYDLRPVDGISMCNKVREISPDISFIFVSFKPIPPRLNAFLERNKDIHIVYKNNLGESFLESLRKALIAHMLS